MSILLNGKQKQTVFNLKEKNVIQYETKQTLSISEKKYNSKNTTKYNWIWYYCPLRNLKIPKPILKPKLLALSLDNNNFMESTKMKKLEVKSGIRIHRSWWFYITIVFEMFADTSANRKWADIVRLQRISPWRKIRLLSY